MDEIVTLVEIDWKSAIIALVLGLSFAVGFWKLLIECGKLLGIKTKRQQDRELLLNTVKNLSDLQRQHSLDMQNFKDLHDKGVEQSIKHDNLIRSDLKSLSDEIKGTMSDLKEQMNTYSENRVHDRAQSFEIQKELTDNIKSINTKGDRRDEQIAALMLGSMELLGDKIDQRFSRYVALDGIPENEVEEFDGIFAAYKALNGNHKREEKYKYVKNHMKVIPIEAKIKNDE